MLQIRNPAVINAQNLGRYLPYHLNIDEANGFPGYLSLKVLKELNDPQGGKGRGDNAVCDASSLSPHDLQLVQYKNYAAD